jgi:LacI family transcriptional regulator
VSRNRTAGAQAALAAVGLKPRAPELTEGELSRPSGAQRAAALLDSGVTVDGIVCGNDMIALGVMDVCLARGIRIPEDVAIVGFDDMSFASAGPLQLTTVSSPRQEMGEHAVGMLLDRINGFEGPAREQKLAYRLQIRATTGAPPT